MRARLGTRPRVARVPLRAWSAGQSDQLQQAHVPGFRVAVVLQTEHVAVGRRGVDAHEHGAASLEDFIVGTDAHAAKIATTANRSSRFNGARDDVVHRTQGDVPVEDVAEQFDDGAVMGCGRSTPRPGPVAATKPWSRADGRGPSRSQVRGQRLGLERLGRCGLGDRGDGLFRKPHLAQPCVTRL
jgi:hypothetical protein